MPINKNQFKRIARIYDLIRYVHRDKESIMDMLREVHGIEACESTIEKDFFFMRNELDIEITYSFRKGGYKILVGVDDFRDILFNYIGI